MPLGITTAEKLENLRVGFKAVFNSTVSKLQEGSAYSKMCMRVESNSDIETYGWLGEFPGLKEWLGDRQVQGLREHSFQIENKLWEDTIGVKRTTLDDDKINIYKPRLKGLAEGVVRHPDELLGARMPAGLSSICYDGQNFFDTDHPLYANHDGTGAVTTVSNYDDGGAEQGEAWYLLDLSREIKPFIFQVRDEPEFDTVTDPATGSIVFMRDEYLFGARARHNVGFGLWQLAYCSRAPLTAANYEKARNAMGNLKADGGKPLGIVPTDIVVPTNLETAAKRLFKQERLANGEDNIHYGDVVINKSGWLQEVA